MARKSARILGKHLGVNAKEVNKGLDKLGLIKQSNIVSKSGSRLWDLTEKGNKFGELSKHPHSSGHIWDDVVIDLLKRVLSK